MPHRQSLKMQHAIHSTVFGCCVKIHIRLQICAIMSKKSVLFTIDESKLKSSPPANQYPRLERQNSEPEDDDEPFDDFHSYLSFWLKCGVNSLKAHRTEIAKVFVILSITVSIGYIKGKQDGYLEGLARQASKLAE